MNLTFATVILESFLLVFVRVAGFAAVAPLFGHKSIYPRLRVFIALCISLCIYPVVEIALPEYNTVLDYSIIFIKEILVGISIGFVSKIIMEIINMAGELIDREIGFTMATNFDPSTGGMVTISAELYDKLVYVVVVITNLHFFILRAIARSFEAVPVGIVQIKEATMYSTIISILGEYFAIGFRIAMPIFLGACILNVILGILTKRSPQMKMFSIVMQLKVIMGLFVLTIAILYVPNIANMLMEKVRSVLDSYLGGL